MIIIRILLVLAGLFFGVAAIGALYNEAREPEHIAAFYCFVVALFSLYWAYIGPKGLK